MLDNCVGYRGPLFGAALLYGDGMITPAISVLSAIEGLNVATPMFEAYVVPLTVVILASLFLIQRHGTARIGAIFGPVTLVWFAVLAALGMRGILLAPRILAAFNPWHGLSFLLSHPADDFIVLGAVFLSVTGAEALYADMGHFGRRPILYGWFACAMPGLLLNYLGQGALLLSSPDARQNPFYLLAPSWALYPLVALAGFATVIASQAVISGAFSLTRQAIQLGYFPRLEITHTSSEEIGQIYIGQINWFLMIAAIGLVLGFESSTNLAGAYGVAVATTMLITTLLVLVVGRERWGWTVGVLVGLSVVFLPIDMAFLVANGLKVFAGGWFPLLVATGMFTVLTTWKTGRALLRDRLREREVSIETLLLRLETSPPARVQGTAVFLTGNPEAIPPALLQNLEHNRVLHSRVILLSLVTAKAPFVQKPDRVKLTRLGPGLFRLIGQNGFMETPNVPELLRQVIEEGLPPLEGGITYFLGRESLLVTDRPGMAKWRERLFVLLSRNALPATAFFRIPSNHVVELGVQVEL